MHGRIKVKTTAEQEAEKAKEREKKLKIYQTAVKRVMYKRSNGELDDEALELTAKILGPNPDFYTLWNFRKEILMVKKKEISEEDMQKLCSEELTFLQSCLYINPKSYSIWLHRRFVMTKMPSADWKRELELCTLFLSYDERNFHCWDYRRFVISNTDVSAEDEFQFTSKKIFDNFSNYSAWHNRSMLLPQVHPDKDKQQALDSSVLAKEFELAQNAFFTDPYDQSAWFYHRWLLGREKKKCDLIHFSVELSEQKLEAVTSFTDPVKLDSASCVMEVCGVECQGSWNSSNPAPGHSHVWIFTATTPAQRNEENRCVKIKLANYGIERELTLKPGKSNATYDWSSVSDTVSLARNEMPAAKASILQSELESCLLLLEEEQDNKWTLLTIAFLMRALDPAKYSKGIEEHLSKLQTVDPYRTGYYTDLRSKFRIERHLEEIRKSQDNLEDISLEGKELTSMCYYQFLTRCRSLRLRNNNLHRMGSIYYLRFLEKLNLDGNKISSLAGLSDLKELRELSLSNNNITSVECLAPLATLQNLQTLSIKDNPICSNSDYISYIRTILRQVTTLDGISIRN